MYQQTYKGLGDSKFILQKEKVFADLEINTVDTEIKIGVIKLIINANEIVTKIPTYFRKMIKIISIDDERL